MVQRLSGLLPWSSTPAASNLSFFGDAEISGEASIDQDRFHGDASRHLHRRRRQVVPRSDSRLIRSLGHSVAAFDSAEDFLQSDRLNETSCLICDVRMPRMTGLELQSDLIGKGRGLPIIFVTANPTESARKCALAAGAIGFLNKPCNEDTLIALLDEALRGRGATR